MPSPEVLPDTPNVLAVDHWTWQLLRLLLRAGPVMAGRELRHSPTRHSKDGSFLRDLVRAGLIEVVTVGTGADERARAFTATYRVTEKGRHAAEYGEASFTRAERGLEPLVRNPRH